MKTIDEAEAQARLDEILNEAQCQPIVIQQQGIDKAVVLSIADYERLRADSIQAFLTLRNDVAREASAAGMTEEAIDALLSDN